MCEDFVLFDSLSSKVEFVLWFTSMRVEVSLDGEGFVKVILMGDSHKLESRLTDTPKIIFF